MIKALTKNELSSVIPILKRFGGQHLSEKFFINMWEFLYDYSEGMIIVNVTNNEINGVIGMCAEQTPDPLEKSLNETFFYSEGKGAVILLNAFDKYAESIKATTAYINRPFESDRIGKLYEKKGFDPVFIRHKKVINNG